MIQRLLFRAAALSVLCGVFASAAAAAAENPPNILIITVDDMNCDSIGAFGCKLPDTSPNIDRLASRGLRFEYAHVQVGNCMPSRNVMFSGRYPHNNRVEGFYQVRDPDYPVLVDLMKQRGYFIAIRGKVNHSTPFHPYGWDLILDTVDGKAHPKDVHSYYVSARQGIAASKSARKPFCLIVNISDPHKPFYAQGRQGQVVADPHKPSRVFAAAEVPVPGFLPDDPVVRQELAHYYSSVRRADDCVGGVLKALQESGQDENTVVMFLSDHGMPLPFAKTNVYHHSTRTPWIVHWPGVTQANSVDTRHMISAVDLLPTLLDIAGVAHPPGLDGRSFLPLVRGESQSGRELVFKVYNENSGAGRHPMRSVQTRKYGYIFNPWADGERVFKTATMGTMTYRKMKELAQTDKDIAARVDLFDHRVQEEFYDYEKDPDALYNLIEHPAYQEEIGRLRKALEDWMVETGDHALEAFRHRDDDQVVADYMSRVQQEASARRRQRSRQKQGKAGTAGQAATKRNARLIRLQPPDSVAPGKQVIIHVPHAIPDDLGEQLIHVTLKHGQTQKRIDRKVLKAKGTGVLKVAFEVPPTAADASVRFAAFIGSDYAHHLQHVVTAPVRVD